MANVPTGVTLTQAEREALDRLLVRLARSAEAVEQVLVLELVERLANSGNLAALKGVLESISTKTSALPPGPT